MALSEFGPSFDGALRAAFKTVVPNSLKFAEIKVGIETKRNEIKIDAQQATYISTSNRVIRFKIPNQNFLDFRRGYVSFNCVITRTGGTFVRSHNGIWSLFDRLRVNASHEIEDIRRTNILQNILFETTTEPDIAGTVGNALWGIGTAAERNAFAAGRQYALPLISGFLGSALIPIQHIQDTIEVELYIGDPTTTCETDGTVPVVTLTNVELHCDRVTPRRSYVDAIGEHIAQHGLNIGFKSFEHYQNTVTTSRSSNQINHRSDSVDSIISIMRDANTVNDPTVFDKFRTWNKNAMITYQLKFNGVFHPEEPITTDGTSVQSYIEMLRWLGKWRLNGIWKNTVPIDGTAYNTDKFLIPVDLVSHPDEMLVNPKGTARASADIQLDLTLNAAPGTPQQLESFVRYHLVANINTQGKITRVF